MTHVLYSFPHPVGGVGIGTVAWHHVDSLARAGARVTVVCTALHRSFDPRLPIRVVPVLGPIRPRMIGRARAADLVDRMTARQLRIARPDVVHTWPRAVLRTAARAAELGVPSVREAPSPYTRTAISEAAAAWTAVGLDVPAGHFHRIPESVLALEDREFSAVDLVLVGSPEAARSFDAAPVPVRVCVNRYGFDAAGFHRRERSDRARTAVFIGRAEPAKGVHVLLRAWSRAHRPRDTRLLIRGAIPPDVRQLLAGELDDPSVVECPPVDDIGAFLAGTDVLIHPSFSEGSALVTYEALGAGVVPLVSTAAGSPVRHDVDGLVHATGSEAELVCHLERVLTDPAEWSRLRANGESSAPGWTWDAAAARMLELYRGLGSSSPTATAS
ncbi:glycosyltransferase family 4 protein [Nocardioides sp. YIM 152315]|uniref:glycosyltransferase family 4 protein n=1 Tax=Nocardioides sp. YIM 152315 TaxID=3031760 RepID=UPI0023DCE88C|nr:glycosyltransferase family 4 protein [Nocardioides sp. YIM 152315]MDF1603448.1 glycosyltransferase family 4 protein [Nocardioides sp. YIM 152315]